MKRKSTSGMIKALLLFIIIVITIVGVYMSINKNIRMQKDDSIIANMLSIKSSCKVYNENRIRTKSEDPLIGTKLSDIKKSEDNENSSNSENSEDNENSDDNKKEAKVENKESNNENTEMTINIIEELKNSKIISEEEYEKYYLLTDKDLEQLKIDVKNEKESYYLINYETNEVIITKGYEGKYKLSEIEKYIEETKNNTNDKTEEEKDNIDNKTEEDKDNTDNQTE